MVEQWNGTIRISHLWSSGASCTIAHRVKTKYRKICKKCKIQLESFPFVFSQHWNGVVLWAVNIIDCKNWAEVLREIVVVCSNYRISFRNTHHLYYSHSLTAHCILTWIEFQLGNSFVFHILMLNRRSDQQTIQRTHNRFIQWIGCLAACNDNITPKIYQRQRVCCVHCARTTPFSFRTRHQKINIIVIIFTRIYR